MPKRKISAEDKIYAVKLYLDGKKSQCQIASMFGIALASVQQWIRNYESMGTDAFTFSKNKGYPKELNSRRFWITWKGMVLRMIFVKSTESVQKVSYKSG